ncbi:MAG: hydrogenase small subunit [Nitrososphaerota archaeon]|nr:hydrogenase small subunit [Nitrososphaerales archaeon]MDW8044784.1 hydrogenase small subunit [Nitrososphaerota archaeon]
MVEGKRQTTERREFLKLLATVGVGSLVIPSFLKQDLIEIFAEARDYWHICWLNGAACTGCAVSLAQAADPDLIKVLTSLIVGNSNLPIALPDYMQVLHPSSGSLAIEFIDTWKKGSDKKRILIVEGSVQKKGFCKIGGRDFRDWLLDATNYADYVISFGSCSSYGGIPHAKGNVTGAMGVQDFYREVGIKKLVINLPRCPGHPDSLILTLAAIMVGKVPELDAFGRPKDFYGINIHSNRCAYRPYYDRGIFIQRPGEFPVEGAEEGCRYKIGCKGPVAYADCGQRRWNNGVSWCIEVGSPCIACSEPAFPDGDTGPFWQELPGLPLVLGIPIDTWGKAMMVAGAAGVAIHFAKRVITKRGEGERKEEEKEEEGGE